MRFLALLPLALPVLAGVAPARRESSDLAPLRYLSSLGHLQFAILNQGLSSFNQADFVNDGLPLFTRGRLEQIQRHTNIHNAFLQQAITDTDSAIVQPCTYVLPLDDPRSLVHTSADIETIVASVYNDAVGTVDNKEYRIALASIFGNICRHAGWLNSAVLKENPWNTAFDVPLTPRQAWTALQRYISNCPVENASLFPTDSLIPFPQLDVVEILVPESLGRVQFDKMESFAKQLYVVFKSGISELRTALAPDGSFIVPPDVANRGATYIFVISDEAPVTDEIIVAGPTLLDLNFSSSDTSF